MRAALILMSFFVCSPALAAGSERVDLMLQLLRKNGCSMTGAEAAAILPQHGFTKTESREIEAELIKRNMIDQDKLGAITLTQKACKG